MDDDVFAQEAYQTYGCALDQHGMHAHLPLPAWEDLPQAEQDVWHQVAVRIVRCVYAEQSVIYVADEG